MTPGQLWTVVVDYAEAGTVPSVGGARLQKPYFPIETWPRSSDCPYPTINNATYEFHRAHGVDTFFVGEGSLSECGSSAPGSLLWDSV